MKFPAGPVPPRDPPQFLDQLALREGRRQVEFLPDADVFRDRLGDQLVPRREAEVVQHLPLLREARPDVAPDERRGAARQRGDRGGGVRFQGGGGCGQGNSGDFGLSTAPERRREFRPAGLAAGCRPATSPPGRTGDSNRRRGRNRPENRPGPPAGSAGLQTGAAGRRPADVVSPFALMNRKHANAQVSVVRCAALWRSACRSEDRRSQPAAQRALTGVSARLHSHSNWPALRAPTPRSRRASRTPPPRASSPPPTPDRPAPAGSASRPRRGPR